MIINLISGPRNLSTALMYSFAQRHDTQVIDEPFYAAYLARTGKEHPGKAEVMATQSADPQEVWAQLLKQERNLGTGKSILFVKNMAHHMENLPQVWWEYCTNIYLIRHPQALIASFAKVIEQPDGQDIGVELEYEFYKEDIEKKKESGEKIVVLDTGELVKNPSTVLTDLCESLAIPFLNEMLSWEAGARPEDGSWAKYWYKNVHQSTGFKKQRAEMRPLPEQCQALYDRVYPLYIKMFNNSIKAI